MEKEIAVRRQQKAEFQDIFEQACSLRNTKMRELDDVLHEFVVRSLSFQEEGAYLGMIVRFRSEIFSSFLLCPDRSRQS